MRVNSSMINFNYCKYTCQLNGMPLNTRSMVLHFVIILLVIKYLFYSSLAILAATEFITEEGIRHQTRVTLDDKMRATQKLIIGHFEP